MRKSLKIEDLEGQLNLWRAEKQKKNFQIKKLNTQGTTNQISKESGKKNQKSIPVDKEEVNRISEEKQQDEALKKELDQKTNDLSSLSIKLAQRDKKISELERKIKEINIDHSVNSFK